MDGTMNRRPIRRTLLAFVIASFAIVGAAPMAHADPCAPLDLACTLGDTTTTVGGVLEDTTATAGEVLEETTTTVGGVLDETTSTVGDVLDGIPGPVGGGSIPVVPPGAPVVVPGEQPPVGGNTPVEQPVPPHGNGPGGGGSTHGVPPATGPRGPVAGPGLDTSPRLAIGSAGVLGHAHVRFWDGGSASWWMSGAGIARALAFPVVLILLVIGFVFVQHRIDRRDPKLALAPVSADVLTFS